mmetsp:Transcript_30012/g.51059  ORF Transcript_30012/g.51059 Transcript_30012/m.51059 type:complete len:222 (-) Transcript_30012:234-899(-)
MTNVPFSTSTFVIILTKTWRPFLKMQMMHKASLPSLSPSWKILRGTRPTLPLPKHLPLVVALAVASWKASASPGEMSPIIPRGISAPLSSFRALAQDATTLIITRLDATWRPSPVPPESISTSPTQITDRSLMIWTIVPCDRSIWFLARQTRARGGGTQRHHTLFFTFSGSWRGNHLMRVAGVLRLMLECQFAWKRCATRKTKLSAWWSRARLSTVAIMGK